MSIFQSHMDKHENKPARQGGEILCLSICISALNDPLCFVDF